jgi:hypothetical protein
MRKPGHSHLVLLCLFAPLMAMAQNKNGNMNELLVKMGVPKILEALSTPQSSPVKRENLDHDNRIRYDKALASGKSPEEAWAIATGPNPDKVKEVIKVPGQPFRVIFEDGKTIGFKLKTRFSPLRTSITLSENSCTRMIGTKGEFVIPLVLRGLIAYWIVHPTSQGQAVLEYDSTDKKDEVKSSVAFLTYLSDANFNQTLAQLPTNSIEEPASFAFAKGKSNIFGWFECPKGNCGGLLPKKTEVLFWDENFELQNEQVRMSRADEGPALNQMSSRLQSLKLIVNNGKIVFAKPARSFGFFSSFLPPGISYQVQWTFPDRNLVEPDDELCQMKWDIDFSRIFTQFTKATEELTEVEKVNLSLYPDYNYEAKDEENLSLNNFFGAHEWEDSQVKR